TIVGLWIAWVASWIIAAFWSDRAEKKGGIIAFIGSRILFYISVTFLLAQFWHLAPTAGWILVALTAAGFSFVWWARIHLGRLWSDRLTKKAGHHVVDTGPYRLVRPPTYSGLIFAGFATAILKGTSYALLGAAPLTFAFYVKARQEERFLRTELGEGAYDAYARKTSMLV